MANDGTTGASADAIELLVSQHREVDQLWSQLQAAGRTGGDLQKDLARRIIEMLTRHDAVETQLLYPALRGAPGGEQFADHGLEEHRKIRQLLADADEKDPGDEKVFASLREALDLVGHHVEEEEGEMFPALRSALGQEKLTDLGRQMATAYEAAPTHPRRLMPNNPIAAAVAGKAAAVVDRVKDAIKR